MDVLPDACPAGISGRRAVEVVVEGRIGDGSERSAPLASVSAPETESAAWSKSARAAASSRSVEVADAPEAEDGDGEALVSPVEATSSRSGAAAECVRVNIE